MSDDDQAQELEYFMFKVTTRKGEFWVELARPSMEEAELAVWETFVKLKLPYQRIEARKNMMGVLEQHINIDEDGQLHAGEGLWKATGRVAEFEATKIAMDATFAAEREDYEQRRGEGAAS